MARGWPLYEIGRLEAAATAEPGVYLEVVGAHGTERVLLPGVEWDQSETPTIDRLRRNPTR